MGDWLRVECRSCGDASSAHPLFHGCRKCGGTVLAEVPVDFVLEAYAQCRSGDRASGRRRGVTTLALPELPPVTFLGEGDTPMLPAGELAGELGLRELFIKNEAVNPTGSYKDRMNAVAVAVAASLGLQRVTTSSTGNQAVSLAAHSAAAGLRADVFLPKEAPRQAAAEVERLGGFAWISGWDERAAVIRALVDRHGYAYVGRNSPRPLANPYGLEGYKSIAYEIVRDLDGRSPDLVVMPSCGGDGIFGTWRGFDELFRAGVTESRPRMVGCGVAAAPSVARAFGDGFSHVQRTDVRPSIGLSLVDAQGGDHALWALYESEGMAVSVDDGDLVGAMARYGHLGVFAEPAGAAGLAGLGRLGPDWIRTVGAKSAVVVMTGGGGRWPAAVADLPEGRRAERGIATVLATPADSRTRAVGPAVSNARTQTENRGTGP